MSNILKAFIENEATIRRVVAKYCPRPEDVDELTQEIFLRAFAAELKSEIRDPKAFLLKIAKNLSLYEIKKHAYSKTDYADDTVGGMEALIDGQQVSMDDDLDSKRKLYVLSQAIASLAPEYRIPLLMKKMDHLKFNEIADELNISKQAAEKRVVRALVACKNYLAERGYDLSELDAFPAKRREKSNNGNRKVVTPLPFRSAR